MSDEFAQLREVLTFQEPFGPPHSEQLIVSDEVFLALYQSQNVPHEQAAHMRPSYILGRRGAGKTSFLIGTALASGATVIRIRSEDVYTEVDEIIGQYARDRGGELVADSICYIWETVLSHAALRAAAVTAVDAPALMSQHQLVWTYVNSIADLEESKLDDYLAAVLSHLKARLFARNDPGSFRHRCASIVSDGVAFTDAMAALDALVRADALRVDVVVDNLEDFSAKITRFRNAISGLFRFVARTKEVDAKIYVPYGCQFCFPSEILPTLYRTVANAEKDLRGRLSIMWHAKELLHIAGNRLAYFMTVHDLQHVFPRPWSDLRFNELPLHEDRAIDLLRAVLPETIYNGFGGEEDPIAYVLRHTHLLPRHLIVILNTIFWNWLPGNPIPISADRITDGVRGAEDQLSKSIASAYEVDFPNLMDAIERMRNRIPMVTTMQNLHRIYSRAGATQSGLAFDQFMEGMLTIGALGLERDEQRRYHIANFAYTERNSLRPANVEDKVCIHPLFVRYLHDSWSLSQMRSAEVKPVYPFGCLPDSPEYRQR